MKTIMLVDDSATLLLSVSNILTRAGYRVEQSPNAYDGLKKLNNGIKVDLLITDLNMPGMDGIEFIKEVRKLPNYRYMPILFQTTESQQDKRALARAAGASGWLVKPVSAADLLNTIKLVIR
ncbi:response regulator [bacterium SGD-2]|nr:response regulator [bacterium SGD-2]